MKIKVTDIKYYTDRRDLSPIVDYVLNKEELIFATEDLSTIHVDKPIDDTETLLTFAGIEDMIFLYHVEEQDNLKICTLKQIIPTKLMFEEWASQLPTNLTIDIDVIEEDSAIEEAITDYLVEYTEWPVEGFTYEIIK